MAYPIFLHVRDLPCLVVGGGPVGLRKALGLVAAGARVTLVDPDPLEAAGRLGGEGGLRLVRRSYMESDLEGMRLVFAAAGNRTVNATVAEDARRRRIFCNVADDPSGSDFFLPALVKRGDLTLAISTGGRSPALARKLRMDLEATFDEAYLPFLDLMGRVRELLLQRGHDPEGHREVFRSLVEGPLLETLRSGNRKAVAHILASLLGEEAADLLETALPGSGTPPETPETSRKK